MQRAHVCDIDVGGRPCGSRSVEPPSHTLHNDTPQTEVIATGEILGTHEMPGHHSQQDKHIRAFTASECQQVADRIATTRRCIYRGRGVGLQVPWEIPTYHLLLVVSYSQELAQVPWHPSCLEHDSLQSTLNAKRTPCSVPVGPFRMLCTSGLRNR